MRPSHDYGHHLNEHGEPMCRICRVKYSNHPAAVRARLIFYPYGGENKDCVFCKRIIRILAEMRALGIEPTHPYIPMTKSAAKSHDLLMPPRA